MSNVLAAIFGFFLKHWVWFAMAGALFAANHYRGQVGRQDTAISILQAEKKASDDRAAAAENAFAVQAQLALVTAQARANENHAITIIREGAASAKGEIANAPGASDAFRYSDPAYRFMRRQPEAEGRPSGDAAVGQ